MKAFLSTLSLLLACSCTWAQYNPPVVSSPPTVVQNWPLGTVIGQTLTWNGTSWVPGSASVSGVGGTNAAFYMSGSGGYFTVSTVGGLLIFSVSNGVVNFNTNVTVTGTLTVNSTTNTDSIGNLVATGWMVASNGLLVTRQHIGVTNYTVPQNPIAQAFIGLGTNQQVTLPNGTNGFPDGGMLTFVSATNNGSLLLTNANGAQTILEGQSISVPATNRLTIIWDSALAKWH